jgi:hypothetical protein
VRGRRRSGCSSAELLLCRVEVSVFLVERELGEAPALGRSELLRSLDAVGEAPRHRAQRQLRIDVQPPCHVDGGEQDVTELLEELRARLLLRGWLSNRGNRLLQLAQLVVEVGEGRRGVGILELDRGGPPLQLPRVQERGEVLGDMVEDPLPVLLVGLEPLPVLAHPPCRSRLDIAKDVRVARDQLLVDLPRDRSEVTAALLFEQQRQEIGLEEEVAEFVLELRRVTEQRGVRDLVGLLDRVRDDGSRRLLAVPRTVTPKAFGELLQLEECVRELFPLGAQPVAALSAAVGL